MRHLCRGLFSRKGLTLAELLIAAIIVTIIMLGIVSIDLALRQSEKGTSRNALVAQRTSAMMLHVVKHVEQAAPYQTGGGLFDPGVSTGDQQLWVRMQGDPDSDPSTWNPDSSDDQWICYDISSSSKLRYCEVTGPPTDCASPSGTLETLGDIADFQASLVKDSAQAAQMFHVQVTLTNRFDVTEETDPLDNPEYVLTTNIYPNTSTP